MIFPTTHWSQLAKATLNGEATAQQALEGFCRNYREPVHRFIRWRGIADPEAEDVTHEFLMHVMEKSLLQRLDPARGRFRSFLLNALVWFLSDKADHRQALKRGGGAIHISMDDEGGRLVDLRAQASEDEVLRFDREWAMAVLERAMDRLRSEQGAGDNMAAYGVLKQFLPGDCAPQSYEGAAAELSLSVPALKSCVHRLRQRLGSLVREEVTVTVASPHEIKEEIDYLQRVLVDRGTDLTGELKPPAVFS